MNSTTMEQPRTIHISGPQLSLANSWKQQSGDRGGTQDRTEVKHFLLQTPTDFNDTAGSHYILQSDEWQQSLKCRVRAKDLVLLWKSASRPPFSFLKPTEPSTPIPKAVHGCSMRRN